MGQDTGTGMVSCIMIFLDGMPYLDEAIRSVVEQAQAPTWELILVDDGSTDGSTDVALHWAHSRPARIKYVAHPCHENRGMSASRNLGIQHARGEFITFLDCDDVMLPFTLAHVVRLFDRACGADALIGRAWSWRSWDDQSSEGDILHLVAEQLATDEIHDPPKLFQAVYGSWPWRVPAMGGVFIRSTALTSIGGFEDDFRGLYEDQVFYAKIGLELPVVVDPRPYFLYRRHGQSETGRASTSLDTQPAFTSFVTWLAAYTATLRSAGRLPPTFESTPSLPTASIAPRGLSRRWLTATLSRSWRRRAPARAQHLFRRWRHTDTPGLRGTRLLLHEVAGASSDDVVSLWSRRLMYWWGRGVEGDVGVVGTHGSSHGVEVLLRSARSIRRVDTETEAASCDWVIVIDGHGHTESSAEQVLVEAHRLVKVTGGVMIFLPGPASPGARLKFADPDPGTPPPSLAEVIGMAKRTFPYHDVHAESLGNSVTLRALTPPIPATQLAGTSIDRHDPRIEVMLAILVEPRSSSGELPAGAAASQRN